ncbi:MAG: WbqC family protein [Chloroflexi bacterium]|nr:WbqC family protein [Chloroflexota bacterium]
MLVAIHQPNFLPRPKVLDKILSADLTIWLDNVQYVRREWQNRALVRDSSGEHHWLSVPVLNRGHWAQESIAECHVQASDRWRHRHLATVRRFYAKSPWIGEFDQKVADLWTPQPALLASFAMESSERIADLLGRRIESVLASDLTASGHRTDRLITLCQAVGASAYLTGTGALSYLDFDAFEKADIRLLVQADVDTPESPDVAWRRLSSLDAILTLGPQKFKELYLKGLHYERSDVGDRQSEVRV